MSVNYARGRNDKIRVGRPNCVYERTSFYSEEKLQCFYHLLKDINSKTFLLFLALNKIVRYKFTRAVETFLRWSKFSNKPRYCRCFFLKSSCVGSSKNLRANHASVDLLVVLVCFFCNILSYIRCADASFG